MPLQSRGNEIAAFSPHHIPKASGLGTAKAIANATGAVSISYASDQANLDLKILNFVFASILGSVPPLSVA